MASAQASRGLDAFAARAHRHRPRRSRVAGYSFPKGSRINRVVKRRAVGDDGPKYSKNERASLHCHAQDAIAKCVKIRADKILEYETPRHRHHGTERVSMASSRADHSSRRPLAPSVQSRVAIDAVGEQLCPLEGQACNRVSLPTEFEENLLGAKHRRVSRLVSNNSVQLCRPSNKRLLD